MRIRKENQIKNEHYKTSDTELVGTKSATQNYLPHTFWLNGQQSQRGVLDIGLAIMTALSVCDCGLFNSINYILIVF